MSRKQALVKAQAATMQIRRGCDNDDVFRPIPLKITFVGSQKWLEHSEYGRFLANSI
jgi:hypothetical protein